MALNIREGREVTGRTVMATLLGIVDRLRTTSLAGATGLIGRIHGNDDLRKCFEAVEISVSGHTEVSDVDLNIGITIVFTNRFASGSKRNGRRSS